MRCGIRVAGRDLAFEQLRQLLDGDLHRAEHRIPLPGGAGDSPTETFYEVGIQRIRHTGQVCCTLEQFTSPTRETGVQLSGCVESAASSAWNARDAVLDWLTNRR